MPPMQGLCRGNKDVAAVHSESPGVSASTFLPPLSDRIEDKRSSVGKNPPVLENAKEVCLF